MLIPPVKWSKKEGLRELLSYVISLQYVTIVWQLGNANKVVNCHKQLYEQALLPIAILLRRATKGGMKCSIKITDVRIAGLQGNFRNI